MTKDLVKFSVLNGHLNRAGQAPLSQPEMAEVTVLRAVIADYKANEAPTSADKSDYLEALDSADRIIQQWKVRVGWYTINKKMKSIEDIQCQYALGEEFESELIENIEANVKDIKTAQANPEKFKKVVACSDLARK